MQYLKFIMEKHISKFSKKLNSEELEMAVQILYNHYGKYFVSDANSLSCAISEEFDCNCLPEEVYKYVNVRIDDEEDAIQIYKNIFSY